MTMMENNQLFRFGARVKRASWRALMARLCRRAHGVTSYPGTMQFPSRFVFLRLPSRWQAPRTARETDRFVAHQVRREVVWRQMASVGKAVWRPLSESARQRTASTEKTLAIPTTAGIGLLRLRRPSATLGRTGRPAALDATPPLRAVRVETGIVRHVRQSRGPLSSAVSARLVMQRHGQPAPVLRRGRRQTPGMRDRRARRARVDHQSKHVATIFTLLSPSPVIGRRVEARLSRMAASAKSDSRSPWLRHVGPLRVVTPRSSTAPHVSNHEPTRSRSNTPGRRGQHDRRLMRFDRGRVVAQGTPPTHRPILAARAMRLQRPVHSDAAKSADATFRIPSGIVRTAVVTNRQRRNDRNVATAFGARMVRRAASARRQRLALVRYRPSRTRNDVTISRLSGAAEHALPLIVRQRTVLNGLREQAVTAPRQAYVRREPRRISAPLPPASEQPLMGSQRVPPVEEVRRILIPLLKETLFSEGTMGRLTEGVATGVERRHSVEHYRKTGGR